MMLHSTLPEVFAAPVAGQVEAEEGVVALAQFLSQLDEELFPFEGNLHDLAPAERVDLDLVLEDHQSDGGDSKLNVPPV